MAFKPYKLMAWKRLFRTIREDLLTLWFAVRDPETPLWVKLLTLLLPAYLLSPFDLVPDFLLVLGIVDDLVVIPLGLRLILKLVPEHVRARSRVRAERFVNRIGDRGNRR
jgi:uncharacterized membrane protein YkvA (DUF1232 family)